MIYVGIDIAKQTHYAAIMNSDGEILSHPPYLTSMQSTSGETLGWRKHKLESRLPGKISITSDMQMTPSLWQKEKN